MSEVSKLTRAELVLALWGKYGLIVVGNVVFFALLYFMQYRPNSRDNRATEWLTLAQREEADHRLQAAETLYHKVVDDYGDTSASQIAAERLPRVLALAKKQRETQPPLPAACTPAIDVKELLSLTPSFYVTELLAGHFPAVEASERERYFSVLDGYVRLALDRDRVALDKLKRSSTFKAGELRQRYFTLKPRVRFVPDTYFDDFMLKNTGFFALHNVVIELSAKQGEKVDSDSVRVAELPVDGEVEVLEFHVRKDGGAVEVEGKITADEGSATFKQRL
jgi:hypothetical protein